MGIKSSLACMHATGGWITATLVWEPFPFVHIEMRGMLSDLLVGQ
jgi:hypothetical protein